jgi:hypothetical protein
MFSTAPLFLIAGTLSLTLFHLLASPAAGLALAIVPMMSSIYYVSVWIAGRTTISWVQVSTTPGTEAVQKITS